MKLHVALLAGAIISTQAFAANEVAVDLTLSSEDGLLWEYGNSVTYASIDYDFPDGTGVHFASEDNVPRVNGNALEYPSQFGAVTGPAFVHLTMPDEATGSIGGSGFTRYGYLVLPQTSLTVSAMLSVSYVLDHEGDASYWAQLTTWGDLGSGSLLDMRQTFNNGSANLPQTFSYTFYNNTDDYAFQGFDLFANADVSGAIAPIPEPATYATMLLGLAALIPAARATRRQ